MSARALSAVRFLAAALALAGAAACAPGIASADVLPPLRLPNNFDSVRSSYKKR